MMHSDFETELMTSSGDVCNRIWQTQVLTKGVRRQWKYTTEPARVVKEYFFLLFHPFFLYSFGVVFKLYCMPFLFFLFVFLSIFFYVVVCLGGGGEGAEEG